MTISTSIKHQPVIITGGLLFYGLLVLAYYVYLPGIYGSFILDDIPNISPIGKYQELGFWNNFWLYLLEGRSGPAGRPISLASFYLNDMAWPSLPADFILTNIYIHLLNGALLFWFSIKLSNSLRFSPTQRNVVSITATTLWLLHPLQTTTVLYIVQRMTELSATFTFTGLLFYLYGREQLHNKPVAGFTALFIGTGTSLLLAILSKENGILLVAYILALEYFLLRPFRRKAPDTLHYWLIPTVIAPFVLLLIYIAYRSVTGSGYETRDFTLGERLLTQARILFDYLHHILMPHIGDSSLFHDDYVISRHLLNPWTTLPAVLGIIALITISLIFSKKLPLLAFAILWFFMGHLIESTVLPLELYYEHRNYLPMLGFFLALGIFFAQQYERYKKPIISVIVLTTSLFIFLTYQNTVLWGKPVELVTNWYQAHPHSLRTQEYLHFYSKNDSALKMANQTTLSTYATMRNLSFNCRKQTIKPSDLKTALNAFQQKNIHTSTTSALKKFFVTWRAKKCEAIKPEHIEHFLQSMLKISLDKGNGFYTQHLYFWLSRYYMSQGNLNNAMINMEKAYSTIPDASLLLIQAGYLSSAGLYQQALDRLDQTELLTTSYRKRLIMKLKQPQFEALRLSISKMLEQEKDKVRLVQ